MKSETFINTWLSYAGLFCVANGSLLQWLSKAATMDKHPLNCKKFDSYTSPCTKRDNEALKELRRLINVGGTYPGDIFYKAKAVCMNCKDFEPEFC